MCLSSDMARDLLRVAATTSVPQRGSIGEFVNATCCQVGIRVGTHPQPPNGEGCRSRIGPVGRPG